MKTLIGGAIASVLGLIGMAVWADSIIMILTGIIPPVLLACGLFALYIGFDEIRNKWQEDEEQ